MGEQNYRILALTVDCWSEKTGADTMARILSWCEPSKLANIYIRANSPSYSVCSHYFQIIESRVFKSIINKRIKTGRIVATKDEDIGEYFSEKRIYGYFKRYRPRLLLILRELLWKLGNWKSVELMAFIDNFEPDVIIFPFEGYIHFGNIVEFCISRTKAKAIGIFWDDNFTYKQNPNNMIAQIQRYFQRKRIGSLVKMCQAYFAIAPKTKREADSIYNIESTVLTKPLRPGAPRTQTLQDNNRKIRIVYTGNLQIGRLDTLMILAKIIHEVDPEASIFRLDVYTNTKVPPNKIKRYAKFLTIHESVLKTEIFKIQEEANVLLLLEAINGEKKYVARLSFSTKAVEYLSVKRCILAIAQKDSATIEYLCENDAALCASDTKGIRKVLLELIAKEEIIDEYANRAYRLGKLNHNSNLINSRVIETIDRVLKTSRRTGEMNE